MEDSEVREQNKIPIWNKLNLTIDEAAEYTNIGKDKLYELTNDPTCPFVLFIGRRHRLLKRLALEKYLENVVEI